MYESFDFVFDELTFSIGNISFEYLLIDNDVSINYSIVNVEYEFEKNQYK